MKKYLIAVIIMASSIINHNSTASITNNIDDKAINQSYETNLAILNKSFKRDLERSAILYQSFEKFFIDYEKVPFYIVIPANELTLFKDKFDKLIKQNKIKKLPIFLSEQEVLKRGGEPDISYSGLWTQQVIKLCFGLTGIAKNYIMIDSDNYFTKEFDYKILFQNDILKTRAWALPKDEIEKYKTRKVPYVEFGGSKKAKEALELGLYQNVYKSLMLIKDYFGNKEPILYSFVTTPFLFNSEAIYRMRALMDEKGDYNFAMLIRMVPFEMQWYGEYILQYENFIKQDALFTIINNPDECVPEDGGKGMYGLWFQSVIYDFSERNGPPIDNDQFIYKRPKHCSK